ncbi:leucine-rich repeat domain-containing protein [Actinoplanes sp. G11-F43]|uniref:leucine-rich repeat domain-containing protein n=1 Tax=Actinoplanes sp. G11-F43 TaxID=3424130 RepID=UPI003D33A65B
MSTEEPRIFTDQFAGAAGPGPRQTAQQGCRCTGFSKRSRPVGTSFHGERQDTTAPGWLRLLELIDEAAADGREEFAPLAVMPAELRRDVITLPAAIGRLTRVRTLVLYGSNLVRIPPEIGLMSALESFSPYTSRRLHWFPYEITRCARLRDSTVSTRWLFGNFKHRPPFPALRAVTPGDPAALDPYVHGISGVRSCSVCDQPFRGEFHQVWHSLWVATDVLPLLVTACSRECLDALPAAPENHVRASHLGGAQLVQPSCD